MVWMRVCRRGALPDGGAAGVKAVELPEGVKGWADGRLASFLANTAGVAEPCRVSVRYADGEEDEIQQTRAGWISLKARNPWRFPPKSTNAAWRDGSTRVIFAR